MRGVQLRIAKRWVCGVTTYTEGLAGARRCWQGWAT